MADRSWRSTVEEALGVSLGQWQTLGGGDFAQSYAAIVTACTAAASDNPALAVGERLFIKTHASPPPNHFSTEALGLQWLRETDTVNVPAVLGVSDEIPYLALAWVNESSRRQGDTACEAQFGRQLSALHQSDCAHFGRADRRTTGSQGLPNEPQSSWSAFYATQRLLPLARLASERKALAARDIRSIETLAERLPDMFPEPASASRLHGDLWAGNRLVDNSGTSWVIDPASHGGHHEFDLAMMRLFGGYGEACFAAYQEATPLEPDWQQRIALHQLAPLIVHAIKFGSAYVQATRDALSQYV